ncbi:MAG: type II secretion system protein [Bacteroidota bacterium]
MKKDNQKGFTLMELLIVIAIITLILSMILARASEAKKRSRDARRMSDLAQFSNALELFYNQYGVYPCGDARGIGIEHDDRMVDGSGSKPFLNGVKTISPPNPDNCNGSPWGGIAESEFYSLEQPKDPINSFPVVYYYIVNKNRQKYVLNAKLESEWGTKFMENDGGFCNKLFEKGHGLDDPVTFGPREYSGDPWEIDRCNL